MKKFTRIISLLLVLCMVLSVAPAITIARAADADADLWVDPVNGSDTNDGTTEQTAFKTINAAKTKAAELSANGDVVVILKDGTYDATETITFGEAESGKNGNTITYRAASGATPLISGGEQLDGWTLHDANHNIYVTDIPEGAELTRQFYVDGEPQPVASMELTPTSLRTFTSYGYESVASTSADTSYWLRVDLGEGKLVSSVTLYGDDETSATTGKAMGFPEDFIIETSPDGITWTTQVTETGFAAPNALGGVEFNFSSTAARYIRIKASKLGNPLTNTQTNALAYYMAFTEVQVGFTSKANAVNLGVAQHVDLDSALASASDVSLTTNTPYALTVSSSATAIGGISVSAASTTVNVTDNIKIQATTDGTNWKTVYAKNGYTWKLNNFFAINTVAATKIRIITAKDITLSEMTVHAPAKLSGSVTASGSGSSYLMDGKFDASFNSGSQTSAIYNNEIVVNLGSTQAVGGVRLYPTYNGTKVTGYMTAARILVSTDGVTYHTALELPSIQTPTGGAQVLVFPRGYNAQYIKIQPLMLTEATDGTYSLQLDELEIVPSKIEAINAEDDIPNIVTKKVYSNISWGAATPILGYYADASDLSGTPTDHQAATGEDACIIDGSLNSRGVSGDFSYSELVAHGGSKVPAFYVTLAEATTFNALTLAEHSDLPGAPLSFTIEAYDGTNWIELVDETSSPWVASTTYEKTYSFDSVTATAVRVLVYDIATATGATPSASDTTTALSITELTLANMTEITYEEEPELDADTVVYDKVSLSSSSILNFGYYNGTDLESFTAFHDGSGSKIFDGNYNTYGATHGLQYQWMPPYGPLVPALEINAVKGGKPSTINAIELAVREDGLCAPYDFMLQVTTSADKDNWTTVAKCEEKDWKVSNKAIFKFPEMDVYKVRLVATLLTPATNISEDLWNGATTTYMHINELSLLNINDPTNPIAADLVSQGEGSTGTVIYDTRGATANSASSSYPANRAVDGFIEPMENAGLSVTSDARYNFSYLKHPEYMEMHSLYLWYHRIQHFSSASLDGTELYTVDGLGAISGEIIMPTWLSNDYLFLDCPGEWYIDRNEGKIYYMADGTMDGKTAILPVTDKIIDMEDVQNVTFEGITFSHTSWTYPSTNEYLDQQANGYLVNGNWMQVPAGIDLTSCINVVFDGVQIRNMGTAGIRIKSDGDGISDGCKVINSLVCDISYSGIVVGEIVAHHGYRDWQLVKNATVQNNLVTRIGIDMFDSVGIFVAYTNGAVIDHNEVAYTPYSGISLGWGWDQEEELSTNALTEVGNNKVTNNFVHDVCRTVYDGGAIYTLGWQEGSVISGNYIYNSGSSATKTENAIYLDEGSAYMQVTGNVIDSTAQSWLQIYFSSIHDNTVTGNYYRSGLGTRGAYVNIGNTTTNNTSFTSVSSNAQAKAIADASGLTDNAFEATEKKGFVRQHNIGLEYWGSTDGARYTTDCPGWYDVHISGQIGRTYYNNIDNIATIVMPAGTDLSSLTLQYSNYSDWSTSPASGTTDDFTGPVTYTITSSEGSKTWTVNVIEETETTEETEPPVNDDPTVETIPTEPETEGGAQKIDLTGCVLGTCSSPYNSGVANANQNWWSTQSPGWRDLTYFVDGDLSNEIHYGLSNGERADFYVDLTKQYGGAMDADQLKLYYGGYNSYVMSTITFVLDLADGTQVTHQVAPNWGPSNVSPVVWTFGQTYSVKGVYVWADSVVYGGQSNVTFGEFELYKGVDETTDPETPTTPTKQRVDLTGTVVGACSTNSATAGSYADFTWWSDGRPTWKPLANFVDNNLTTNFSFGAASGERADLYLDLSKGGTGYTAVDEFTIYHSGSGPVPSVMVVLLLEDGTEWTKTYATNWAQYDSGASLTETFTETKNAVGMYIWQNGSDGAHFGDIMIYQVNQTTQEDIQLSAPVITVDTVTDSSITVSVPAVTGGTAKYRLLTSDGEQVVDWQTSGTFTGLNRYTKYTIEAMYVGSTGYTDSLAASVDQRTAKTQLPDVTGLKVVSVAVDSITVTADTHSNGTLQFRINGGSWTTGNTFTGLTENTTYTIEARYKGATGYANSANIVSISVTTEEEIAPAIVGYSYSIRLLEPWALRTFVTFASAPEAPIGLANIKSYGAYAIIEHKFDGTTVEDLIADTDTKVYTSAAGNIVPGGDDATTTVVFDFTDEIYTYRLGENVYWVAYYEDAEGNIHYTDIKSTTIIDVAETVAGQDNVSAKEKAVLDSMQVLKDAVIDFRGEDADLGNTDYADGVSLNNSGINFEQNGAAGTYKFGTSHQIRLIEPWSIRVRLHIAEAGVSGNIDYTADNVNYGMIFFHDKTGEYANGMSIEEMIAEGDALVYSSSNDNIWLASGGVNAVYDKGIYTYELDTNLYCLPYVEVDGQFYYRSSVICWNLLDEMATFSQDTTLSAEEVAVFEAMIDLHEKTVAYRGN